MRRSICLNLAEKEKELFELAGDEVRIMNWNHMFAITRFAFTGKCEEIKPAAPTSLHTLIFIVGKPYTM